MESETLVVLLVLVLAGGAIFLVYKGATKTSTEPNLSTGQKLEAVGGKVIGIPSSIATGTAHTVQRLPAGVTSYFSGGTSIFNSIVGTKLQ